jgi:probable phosphoglycerate mutase
MATFLLIRHGENDWVGKALAGRLPGVHLNASGAAQAERLARSLAGKPIQRVVSSPLERATETAGPIAAALGLTVQVCEEFTEIQFGEWEGKPVAGLELDPRWKLYNSYRSTTPAPGGEMMLETQVRFVSGVERLRREHPAETIAVVSHADPIRAALLHYLGMPIDLFLRLEVRPASISILELHEYGPRVLGLNMEDAPWI